MLRLGKSARTQKRVGHCRCRLPHRQNADKCRHLPTFTNTEGAGQCPRFGHEKSRRWCRLFLSLINGEYTHDMATTPITPSVAEAARIIATLPPDAQKEVLDFALFLQSRIAAQDAQWDAAFAETDTAKLKAWLDAENASDEDLKPMFDEAGNITL